MDRGAWWATVRGVAKSWTRLSDSNFHLHFDIVNHDDSILIYNMLRDLFHRFSSWIPLSEVDFITLNVEIIKLSFHEVGSPGSGHRVRSEWCWSWIHIRSLNKAFRDLIRFDFVFPQERKVWGYIKHTCDFTHRWWANPMRMLLVYELLVGFTQKQSWWRICAQATSVGGEPREQGAERGLASRGFH